MKPSLHFPLHPCHFLCSLATRHLPLPSDLWLHFCFFLSISTLLLFSLGCSLPFPSGTITLPFPPSRVMAVKQERAHGRPLTGKPSESELSCRTKRLQTLAHKTSVDRPASLRLKLMSNKSRMCCVLICGGNNYTAGPPCHFFTLH